MTDLAKSTPNQAAGSGLSGATGIASGLGGQGAREITAIIAVAVLIIGGGEFLPRFFCSATIHPANSLHCGTGSLQFRGRPNENAYFIWCAALLKPGADRVADETALMIGIAATLDHGGWSVKHLHCATPPFRVSINVGNHRRKQPVGMKPDLMGCAVIDAQSEGPTANVEAQRFPRK